MRLTDELFETLKKSLQSILPRQGSYQIERSDHALILEMRADIAAFSVFNGHVQEDYEAAYREFKTLYREHHTDWDRRTLSFVLCRGTGGAEDDRFYAEREHDPLFCRKYVIQALQDVNQQSKELLRLPFLPFPDEEALNVRRPQSAQDLLQLAGVPASLTRKLVEPRRRAPDGIVDDLLAKTETLPATLNQLSATDISPLKPRAISRLTEATFESFRAYRKPQTFDLDASVIVLYGPNGLGKTSFFDGIDYGCTGRIGRLCRQRKLSQEDFSRVATHLDDTPGTGSVYLKGYSDRGTDNREIWNLRRGTGNWSTAWIDSVKSDRTSTLTFLTNAEWGESAPRQQNVESLFRATHLFGQDEQELLTEFRKSSVIPETFISEMLAIQDYAEGIGKTNAVSQLLKKKKTSLQSQEESLETEKQTLAKTIVSEGEGEESPTQNALDKMLADIRVRVSASQIDIALPEESVTPHGLADLIDLASARLEGTEERLKKSRAVRNEIPVYKRAAEKIVSDKGTLQLLDEELESIATESTSLQKQRTDSNAKETLVKSSRIELERRRRELEAVKLWLAASEERKRQLKQMLQDIAKVNAEISVQKGALEGLKSELKTCDSEKETLAKRIAWCRAKQDSLVRLSDGFGEYSAAKEELSDLQQKLREIEIRLRQEDERVVKLREVMQIAEAERKQVAPDFERMTAEQAELDTLLDSIQSHISGCTCELCGTDFSSNEILLQRIRQHRSGRSRESVIASKYASLKAAEADARQKLAKSTASAENLSKSESDLQVRIESIKVRISDYLKSAVNVLEVQTDNVESSRITSQQEKANTELSELQKSIEQLDEQIAQLKSKQEVVAKKITELDERVKHLAATSDSLQEEVSREVARSKDVLEAERITDTQLDSTIVMIQEMIDESLQSLEQLRRNLEQIETTSKEIGSRLKVATERRELLNTELEKTQTTHATLKSQLSNLQLPDDASEADKVILSTEATVTDLRQIITDAKILLSALQKMQARTRNQEVRDQIQTLDTQIAEVNSQLVLVKKLADSCMSMESLLKSERQASVANHIAAYGPLISNIQQRLRSVYGFGGVHLEARGGEAAVQVEWRNKDVHFRPTDFFSDSQKQILMLSVFLAGGLRQNWSGFAPVLLDDPVTHFDDLNAYGFVELLRGMISTEPKEWQFIVSTCEERLFSLMKKKFSRFEGGAIFYEFLGMSYDGPIIERR